MVKITALEDVKVNILIMINYGMQNKAILDSNTHESATPSLNLTLKIPLSYFSSPFL